MPIQLTSRNVVLPQQSDSCVVTRYTKIGVTWPSAIVYSGICDFQQGGGGLAYNEAGQVVQADAKCFFVGVPDIRVDDEMVFNGQPVQTYVVVNTSTWTMIAPGHLELLLKRGPLPYRGKT